MHRVLIIIDHVLAFVHLINLAMCTVHSILQRPKSAEKS